jgi:hypothetical protein
MWGESTIHSDGMKTLGLNEKRKRNPNENPASHGAITRLRRQSCQNNPTDLDGAAGGTMLHQSQPSGGARWAQRQFFSAKKTE